MNLFEKTFDELNKSDLNFLIKLKNQIQTGNPDKNLSEINDSETNMLNSDQQEYVVMIEEIIEEKNE